LPDNTNQRSEVRFCHCYEWNSFVTQKVMQYIIAGTVPQTDSAL